jgi:hypothetical protein
MYTKLSPFFCYYGGKWRAARRYPEPRHDTIIEPFAGAAGYATRYADRKVVLVERDPVIAGLWRYLTRVKSDEILSIPTTVEGTVDDLKICEEAKWLVGFWCNKGASGPSKSPSKWMRSEVRPNSYWGPVVRAKLAAQVDHIRHWQVIEGSYEQAPDVLATWYVDPPYQEAGKHYRCKFTDYAALADWCRSRRGQTIVCENVGATWLPFTPFEMAKSTPGAHGKSYSHEAIWLNDSGDTSGDVSLDGSTAAGLGEA